MCLQICLKIYQRSVGLDKSSVNIFFETVLIVSFTLHFSYNGWLFNINPAYTNMYTVLGRKQMMQ